MDLLKDVFQHSLLEELFLKLNIKTSQKELFLKAFTHQSFVNEFKKTKLENYERLEHLGDAVVGLIVTEELFTRLPEEREGKLAKIKAGLVSSDSLGKLALALKLDKIVLVGKGEHERKTQKSLNLMGDVFESFLGACYLNFGFSKTKEIFLKMVGDKYFEEGFKLNFDYKTKLQELSYAQFQMRPEYLVKEETRSGHSGFFVEVKINNEILASEWNESKKEAMKNLAKKIIQENKIGELNAY